MIRVVTENDFSEWLRLRELLYPECSSAQLQEELEAVFFNRTVVEEIDYSVWVVEISPGKLAGFSEISLRQNAPLCETSPVGYVESLFGERNFRRSGAATKFLIEGENWAKSKLCSEFFVDTLHNYEGAIKCYESFGFSQIALEESEVIMRKMLR